MITSDSTPYSGFSAAEVTLVRLKMGRFALNVSASGPWSAETSMVNLASVLGRGAKSVDFSGYYLHGRENPAFRGRAEDPRYPGLSVVTWDRTRARFLPSTSKDWRAWPWPSDCNPYLLFTHRADTEMTLLVGDVTERVPDWAWGAWARGLPGLRIALRPLTDPLVLLSCYAARSLQRIADQVGRVVWAPSGLLSLGAEEVDLDDRAAGVQVRALLGPGTDGRGGRFLSAWPSGPAGYRVRWAYRDRFGADDPDWLAERLAEHGVGAPLRVRPYRMGGSRFRGLAYFDERDWASRRRALSSPLFGSAYVRWTPNDAYRPGSPTVLGPPFGGILPESEAWRVISTGGLPVDIDRVFVVNAVFVDGRFLVHDHVDGVSYLEDPEDFGRRIGQDLHTGPAGAASRAEWPQQVLLLAENQPVPVGAAALLARGLRDFDLVTSSLPAAVFLDDGPGIGIPRARIALLSSDGAPETPVWTSTSPRGDSVTVAPLAGPARVKQVSSLIKHAELDSRVVGPTWVRRVLEAGPGLVPSEPVPSSSGDGPVLRRSLTDGLRVMGVDFSARPGGETATGAPKTILIGDAWETLDAISGDSVGNARWSTPWNAEDDPFYVHVDYFGGYFLTLADQAGNGPPVVQAEEPAAFGKRIRAELARVIREAGDQPLSSRPVVLLPRHRPVPPEVATAVAAEFPADSGLYTVSMPAITYPPRVGAAGEPLALVHLPGHDQVPQWTWITSAGRSTTLDTQAVPAGTKPVIRPESQTGEDLSDASDTSSVADTVSSGPVATSTARHTAAAVGGTKVPEPAPASESATPPPESEMRSDSPSASSAGGGDTEPGLPAEVPSTAPTQPGSDPVPNPVAAWGVARDGILGLVHLDPLPQNSLTALRDELTAAVHAVADSRNRRQFRFRAGDDLAGRLTGYLEAAWVEERMPYLRSRSGDTIIVRHRGRQYAIRLRLQLTEPVPSAHHPDHDPAQDAQRPLLKLEKRAVAAVESRDESATTNYRSFTVPGLLSWPIASGPVGSVKFTPQLGISHNQTSTTSTAAARLMHLVVMRSRENSKAYDFRLDWQYQIEPYPPDHPEQNRQPQPAPWHETAAHGRVRAVLPDHLTVPNAPSADATDPSVQPVDSLDDIPLYSLDAVRDPGRLLEEVNAGFEAELAGISDGARRVMEEFLGEKAQRSHFPLMRTGGYVSPTLFDSAGEPIGVLQVTAQAGAFRPVHTSTKVMMENYVLRGVRTEGSVSVANTVDLGGQVEVGFTSVPGHHDTGPSEGNRIGQGGTGRPDSEGHLGGQVKVHYDYQRINTRTLDSGGTASLAHSLKSAHPHFLSDTDLHYTVTLIRPGQAPKMRDLGVWADGARIRVQSKALARGIADPPRRYVPEEIRTLRYVGMSATAHRLEGTRELFDRAQRWLQEAGYLPTVGHRPGKAVQAAQLENYRRLALMRSDLGLRSGLDEAIDGGHSAWFDKPTSTGVDRVELRLGARRGDAEPEFARTVEGVQIINWSNSTLVGTESRTEQSVHTLGLAAGIGGGLGTKRVQGSFAPIDLAGEMSGGVKKSAGNGPIYEQALLSAAAQKMDVFDVSLRFSLDLHSTSSQLPEIRFAEQPLAAAEGRAGARPWDAGHMELWLPQQRTTGAGLGPLPASAPATVRLADGARVRQLQRMPFKVPQSAAVDAMAGSAELIQAFRDITAGHYDNLRPGAVGPVTDAVSAAVSHGWWWRVAHGTDPQHAGSPVQQLGREALAPAKLIANGQQILHGVYAVEHLATSGILTDTTMVIELEACLGEPVLVTNPEFRESDHGGFPAYIETDVYAPDSSSLDRNHGHSGQLGVSAELGWHVDGRPSLSYRNRFTHSRGKDTKTSDGSETHVNRVSAEDDRMFRFAADLHYVLTVKRGTRNALANLVGIGPYRDISVIVTVPRGAQFILTGHQVRQNTSTLGADAIGLGAIPGALPPLGTPQYLPERFRAGDGIGLGAVTDVHTTSRGRAGFLRQMLDVVQQNTPGVLTPGHAAYVPGLKTRLSDYASPLGLRALVARGAKGRQVLYYVHQHAGGAELVELELTAAPDTWRLDRIIGHTLSTNPGADNGVETYAAHSGGHITIAGNRTHTTTDANTIGVDYPDGSGSRIAAAMHLLRTTGQSLGLTMEDRTALRTPKAAEFAVPYRLRFHLRKAAMDGALIGLLNRLGPALAHYSRDAVHRLFSASPTTSLDVQATVKLRFAATETTTALPDVPPQQRSATDEHASRYLRAPAITDRLSPAVLDTDPTLPDWRPAHLILDMNGGGSPVRQKPDPNVFKLHHDFAVHTYSAIDQVHEALHQVAPKLLPRGARLWNSEENAAKHLTEMIRRGTTTLHNDRGEFGLDSGNADPGNGPTISTSLSGMHILNTDGIHIDRMRNSTTTTSTATATTSIPDLAYNQNIHNHTGASTTLLEHARTAHNPTALTSANRRDVLKNENGARSSSLEVRADLVLAIAAGETRRWITGTVYLRVRDLDVLGRGLGKAAHNESFFDLAVVYDELGLDPAAVESFTELIPQVNALVEDTGDAQPAAHNEPAHLWLDTTRLDAQAASNAMFLAAHAARDTERAVELSLRGTDGVRHIRLNAEGTLQADDADARQAWRSLTDPHHSRQGDGRHGLQLATAMLSVLAREREQLEDQIRAISARIDHATADTGTDGTSPSQYRGGQLTTAYEEMRGELAQTLVTVDQQILTWEQDRQRAQRLIADLRPYYAFLAAHDAAGLGVRPTAATTTISTLPALGGPDGHLHPIRRPPL